MLPVLLSLALASTAPEPKWDTRRPERNAERVARIFQDVCVARLGQSARMHAAVTASRAGFRAEFAGDRRHGPVWSSPIGRITATDHGHSHDGDECQIEINRAAAPSSAATIAALRRLGLAKGAGKPAEFGAQAFRRGSEETIFVRYTIAEEATGATKADAGLMLLISRPAG
jgi:hypothetical protein